MKTKRQTTRAQEGDVIEIPGRKGIYVVIDAHFDGGGTAMFNDVFPDGWYVTARKLNRNGTYDPKNPVYSFSQSHWLGRYIEKVTVIGKMKKTYVSV